MKSKLTMALMICACTVICCHAEELIPQQQAALNKQICECDRAAADNASAAADALIVDYRDQLETIDLLLVLVPPSETKSMWLILANTIRDGINSLAAEVQQIDTGTYLTGQQKQAEGDTLYVQAIFDSTKWKSAAIKYSVAYEAYRLATSSYGEINNETVIRDALQSLSTALGQ